MVAPQIIFIERLQACVYGNDARAGRIDGEGGNVVAGYARGGSGLTGGFSEGAHVVIVALGGVVRVIFLAMERVLRDARPKTAAPRATDRHSPPQGPEI